MENTAVELPILTERKTLSIASTEKVIEGMKAQLDFLKELVVSDLRDATDSDQLVDVVFKTAASLFAISKAIEGAYGWNC